MKVLLSAYSCAPGLGSEPSVGWEVVRRVASRHDTWVLTNAANRDAIEAAGAAGAHFVFIEPPAGAQALLGRGMLHYAAYAAWQRRALAEARRLHRRVGFDVVHHVTYVNSWLPASTSSLGVPFVWTAGIRDRSRPAFTRAGSPAGRIFERRRDAAASMLGPLAIRGAGRRAAAVLSATDPSAWPSDIPVRAFPLGGLDAAELDRLEAVPIREQRPFRVASIGRLLGWKGTHLTIGAFARLRANVPDAELLVVGDGPERGPLSRLAATLGCADAVRFTGHLPREETLRLLGSSDVLAHLSLHDAFGFVVVEAMAAGRPVVCLDAGAPPLVVGKDGIVISASSPAQVIDDASAALAELASDPDERIGLGLRARARARAEWDWDRVGERLLAVYEEVRAR